MRSFLFLVILLFSIQPALAIVDVHDEYYARPELKAFSVFDFNFSGATGNKEETDLELNTHSIVRRHNTTWLLVAAVGFSDTNGQENENNQFLHARYSRHLIANKRHGFDLIAQYGRDKFEKLQRRLVVGAGYRYEWKEGSNHERGLLGIGVIREHERYTGLDREAKKWRGNLYATIAIPISLPQGANVSFSAYLQPNLQDISDLRTVAVLGLKAQLSDKLAIKASIDHEFYSDRSPGIEQNNVTYSTGISYSLF